MLKDLLLTCTHLMEEWEHNPGQDSYPQMMAWRLANAGGALRSILENQGCTGVQVYDEPTGHGCVLPKFGEVKFIPVHLGGD